MRAHDFKAVADRVNVSRTEAYRSKIDTQISAAAAAGQYYVAAMVPSEVFSGLRDHYQQQGFAVSVGYEGDMLISWANAQYPS